MKQRLQKILASAGVGSRRTAEEMIRQGRVAVDGHVITDMGVKLEPDGHRIEIDGHLLQAAEEKIYILLHKPSGYVTTLNDPQGRPIVTSLLRDIRQRVFPVGRLDFDTEGALLLTNDGELAQHVLHPSFEVRKTYIAQVAGHPSPDKLRQLELGVLVDNRLTAPAEVLLLRQTRRCSWLQITIHEGRKRQVKKMCSAVGHPVLTLKRLSYGNLQLGTLPRGRYRILSRREVETIFSS